MAAPVYVTVGGETDEETIEQVVGGHSGCHSAYLGCPHLQLLSRLEEHKQLASRPLNDNAHPNLPPSAYPCTNEQARHAMAAGFTHLKINCSSPIQSQTTQFGGPPKRPARSDSPDYPAVMFHGRRYVNATVQLFRKVGLLTNWTTLLADELITFGLHLDALFTWVGSSGPRARCRVLP